MKLMVDVEEASFGRVFRILDNMPGVALITIVSEGVKNGRAAPSPVQRRGGTNSIPCIILSELIKGQQNRESLREAISKAGKAKSSLPDALSKLQKAKEIMSIGKGRHVKYGITPSGRTTFKTACENQQASTEAEKE
jgi:hypothetical protein